MTFEEKNLPVCTILHIENKLVNNKIDHYIAKSIDNLWLRCCHISGINFVLGALWEFWNTEER